MVDHRSRKISPSGLIAKQMWMLLLTRIKYWLKMLIFVAGMRLRWQSALQVLLIESMSSGA